MGLLWMRKDDMIIRPTTDILIINSYGLTILIKIILVLSEKKKLMATPFVILVKGARKCQKPLTVFKVLLKDIIKVLRSKVMRIPAEIWKLLPAQYYDHLPLFKGGMVVELPPYCPGINQIFTLEKGKNGQ